MAAVRFPKPEVVSSQPWIEISKPKPGYWLLWNLAHIYTITCQSRYTRKNRNG